MTRLSSIRLAGRRHPGARRRELADELLRRVVFDWRVTDERGAEAGLADGARAGDRRDCPGRGRLR